MDVGGVGGVVDVDGVAVVAVAEVERWRVSGLRGCWRFCAGLMACLDLGWDRWLGLVTVDDRLARSIVVIGILGLK